MQKLKQKRIKNEEAKNTIAHKITNLYGLQKFRSKVSHILFENN